MAESIENKQLDNIATWMIPIAQTKLPSVLKGVFFMDGNPLPDDCITMYNLEWDTQNNSLVLPVFAPVQWTFHNSILGWLLLIGAKLAQFAYKIEFEDATLQQAQITPLAFGISVPRWIIDATMCRGENSDNGDTWKRKNVWFGGVPRIGEYTLRRIVDENGEYTPAFKDMLTKVQNECLVIRTSTPLGNLIHSS
ncbi:hypothetical protein [Halotia branconii]|uniref:Uncharacterized protein n=1 Tax=Halotia branconii CENA392 TaxID=1539056 RepID=A0AAJ6NQX9_9CYAN|nr:hypothetical protein [Halotia branconii]WGV24962.1 hypothetical protein QI031_24860 [Halotia branconii CENA392]